MHHIFARNIVDCGFVKGFDVSSCIRQYEWVSVVLAAWCFQSGAARAGYITVAAIDNQVAGHSLSSQALMPSEQDTGMAMADTGGSTWQRPETSEPQSPSSTKPSCPFATPLQPVYNFGPGGGAGSSSSSAPGTGPSTPPAGLVSRPQVPPLELANLLPPDTGDAHPFSVASFLFRPPRAS